MISETLETLTTGDGVALEARLAVPASTRGGIVFCHPHPLYGGDMENPVVVRASEVCAEQGFATLRFNFRGVGRSNGVHGDGVAEQQDVEAALTRVASVAGNGAPLALAGYSFGAAVTAEVAARHDEVGGVTLVAPPLSRVGAGLLAPLHRFGDRLLIIVGTKDEICPVEPLRRLVEATPEATIHVVEGADHFFFGKLYALGEAVAAWARRLR